MTTDNFCFYLQNRLIQTSQTGGQQYSDTSPFSIPCLIPCPIKQDFYNSHTKYRAQLKRYINFVTLIETRTHNLSFFPTTECHFCFKSIASLKPLLFTTVSFNIFLNHSILSVLCGLMRNMESWRFHRHNITQTGKVTKKKKFCECSTR